MPVLRLITVIALASLLLVSCSRNKQLARAPVTEVPVAGPAPEIENQATSVPIVVETLPEPASTSAEAQPNLAPPAPSAPASKPPKILAEPKRDIRPAPQPPPEVRPIAQTPPIQLLPQFSEREKAALHKKIMDQLDSARLLLKSLNESQLKEQQKPSFSAAVDFIKRSEDALKSGEYYQGLALAEKANTLALSLVKRP
jgi:hypothetical protein